MGLAWLALVLVASAVAAPSGKLKPAKLPHEVPESWVQAYEEAWRTPRTSLLEIPQSWVEPVYADEYQSLLEVGGGVSCFALWTRSVFR